MYSPEKLNVADRTVGVDYKLAGDASLNLLFVGLFRIFAVGVEKFKQRAASAGKRGLFGYEIIFVYLFDAGMPRGSGGAADAACLGPDIKDASCCCGQDKRQDKVKIMEGKIHVTSDYLRIPIMKSESLLSVNKNITPCKNLQPLLASFKNL